MSEFRAEKRVVVLPDADVLSRRVAARMLQRIAKRTAAAKTTNLVVSGGTAVAAVLRAAGEDEARTTIDWSLVHVWWADERLTDDDALRNDLVTRDALLSHVDIPAENVHAFAASDVDADAAAAAYRDELARFAADGAAWPVFDLCLLGVGADGHIAGLFPDRTEIAEVDAAALPVHNSPLPPSERVTLTRPVLNSARRMWLVLPGVDKASALGLALAGASYHSVPAAGAKGRKQTIFFTDEAAAGGVPEDLIEPEF
jgi:6-phosphogluconolactonase